MPCSSSSGADGFESRWRTFAARLVGIIEELSFTMVRQRLGAYLFRWHKAKAGKSDKGHMTKEEMVLFPYIARMEESVIEGEPLLPAPFGTVANPVAMMEPEHDSAGNALRAMRKASNDYVAPEGACASYQAVYRAFVEFEADLHQHIHLENNILFPGAIKMEREK
jgi:regulator of cell morphogenesis and NO signaling